MAYCSELQYGILSNSNCKDLEKMRVVSSVVEKNEYKPLATKSKKKKGKIMVNALRLLEMPLFIGFLKFLREKNKIYFDDDILEEELLKYIELHKKKINYMMITEFENKLATLNRILSYKNKIQEIRDLNFKKEEQTKKELNALRVEKEEELEFLQENLNFLALRNRYLGRSNSFKDKIELEEKTKKRVDEIEKLIRKKEIELINLFITDDKAIDLLLEQDNDKIDMQERLILIEIKSEELKISEITIRAIKS